MKEAAKLRWPLLKFYAKPPTVQADAQPFVRESLK
jgi:hypothetical protein